MFRNEVGPVNQSGENWDQNESKESEKICRECQVVAWINKKKQKYWKSGVEAECWLGYKWQKVSAKYVEGIF